MNHIFRLALLLFNFSFCCAQMAVGTVIQDIAENSSITHRTLAFANDWQDYATGGITFNYPTALFTQAPLIQISIYPNSAHPSTETFTTEISANSDLLTTVMVYNVSAGIVSEAANGSVKVFLYALADPTGISLY